MRTVLRDQPKASNPAEMAIFVLDLILQLLIEEVCESSDLSKLRRGRSPNLFGDPDPAAGTEACWGRVKEMD